MKRNKPQGNHHPYCIKLYQKKLEWRCECIILREYDQWREFKENLDLVIKDSKDYLERLGNK